MGFGFFRDGVFGVFSRGLKSCGFFINVRYFWFGVWEEGFRVSFSGGGSS